MSAPLLFACCWVLAATATALLPMKDQYTPGLFLLMMAPVLLIWIGMTHGFWVAAFGTAAFISMFRKPLIYLAIKALQR